MSPPPTVIDIDEPALVRKARWGDRTSFDALYRLHAPAVYTLALRLCGQAHIAEDITQDTFLKMLRFLGGFREGRPLRPWLKQVAARTAIDRLRRDRPQLYASLDADPDAGLATAPTTHPGSAASTAEAEGLLRRLAPLPRTLVWLHEMEGWTHEELAARFGQSPSWSKSIVSRALARLREELLADTETPP